MIQKVALGLEIVFFRGVDALDASSTANNASCGDGSDGLLKARVWYRLDEATGEFVEVSHG